MEHPDEPAVRPVTPAVMTYDGERWLGRLLGTGPRGPARVSFQAVRAPTHVPLGAVVHVGLGVLQGGGPAHGTAVVVTIERLDRSAIVSFETDDPDLLAAAPTAARSGNRRAYLRAAPGSAEVPPAEVRIDVGPPSGRRIAGRLLDASRGGIALRLPLAAETRLCLAEKVWATLQLPDDFQPVERAYEVRNRVLLGQWTRYGMALSAAQQPAPWPPPFQAQWACECGAAGLLADGHAYCPRCGTARNTSTALPGWDDLITARLHRYTGAVRGCVRCGSAWAEAANNCGHCGTMLPVR